MAGEKREREDFLIDPRDVKKRKLNDSQDENEIGLSPIRGPEEEEYPTTPDTQPLEEIRGDEYDNNEHVLSEDEQQKIVNVFRKDIAELNANEFKVTSENIIIMPTQNNKFDFRLCGHDFYQLPLNIQDELFDDLCSAVQKNTQINALQIYAEGGGGLTSTQAEKLISAARNPGIKKIILHNMQFKEIPDAAKFFESVVIENPHLEDLRFTTCDFHISNLHYGFTEYFQNPENQVNFFKQGALKKLNIKIYDVREFSCIYSLIDQNKNIQDIEVDCDCMETNVEPGYFQRDLSWILFDIYNELITRLKTSFNFVKFELTNGVYGLSHEFNVKSLCGKKDPTRIFNYLIKRNQEINAFSLHKNLILHFYAGLDEDLANCPEEGLSEEHQALLKYVTTKDSPVDVSKLSNEVLGLLDSLLETQLQFTLEKLNSAYQKSFENQTEKLSVRCEAKSNFDAVDQKSQTIKREILKRQSPQVASIIGKDMYASSANSGGAVPEEKQSSNINFGIKN